MGINNRNYGGGSAETVINNSTDNTNKNARSASLAKIFGFLFIGLLITAGVAFLGGYLFSRLLANDPSSFTPVLNGTLIGVSIVQIILTFVISLVLLKGKHSILPWALVYVILMGILLSTFTLFIDWRILGLAFLLTSLVFGVMFIISMLTKGNMNGVALVATMLLMGAGLVGLFTFIFLLIWPMQSAGLVWGLDFIIFFAICLITLYDIHRIRKICEQGELTTNLELYCAFTMYVDFIYIFVKIVTYIVVASKR